jgi:glycerol kinase
VTTTTRIRCISGKTVVFVFLATIVGSMIAQEWRQAGVEQFVLSLDQGTTSSRALLVDQHGEVRGMAQKEFCQFTPLPGHVEHDAEEIWDTQLAVAREVLGQYKLEPSNLAAIGITNQRETTVLWERATGRPIAPAIVWQSRITADHCERLRNDGVEPRIRQLTGLLVDPYFSATKIAYLLHQFPSARSSAERGEILFGTIDSFLIWRLTGGAAHVTDVSNASRTMLLNLETLQWDDELLAIFDIPRAMLPEVLPSSHVYGETSDEIFGSPVPIAGCAGDQQAATFGQCCFAPGDAKNTYGTGCFLLMNVGTTPASPPDRLLTTVGWLVNDQPTYCFEGSVFVAGAAVQWLRDGLGLISESADVERLALSVPDNGGVAFVPALVGLGAPYWDPGARGAILGLSRGSTAGHVARATLESIAHQTCDVLEAMLEPTELELSSLRVDGGAARNDLLMQLQADLLGVEVHRPANVETTALGAAYLAGLATGFWPSLEFLNAHWQLERTFVPQIMPDKRNDQRQQWRRAVKRCLNWEV